MLIMAPGGVSASIGVNGLPPEIGADAALPKIISEDRQDITALKLRDAREVFEREYLIAQITRFGGNVSKTAEFVGMERSALHRKLKLLGVASL
jgi:two-component system nitrogen regulation response regulator NtrX